MKMLAIKIEVFLEGEGCEMRTARAEVGARTFMATAITGPEAIARLLDVISRHVRESAESGLKG
jgi:hypothetical protein